MKKLIILFILITSVAQAQYTIKGTMSPTDKGDWVILSRIDGAKEKFITNTTIKFDTIKFNGRNERIGQFEFILPKNAKSGIYRVKYRLKGGGFVDFIFNKEDVAFGFNPYYPYQSVTFQESEENKLYQEFLDANDLVQGKMDSIQVAQIKNKGNLEANKKAYQKYTKILKDVNNIYAKKAENTLASHFIKASQRVNSDTLFTNPQTYLTAVLDNFFNNIDFNNDVLYNSPFLIDRINDYVFQLNYSDEPKLQQKLYREAITKIMSLTTDNDIKKAALEFLIEKFTNFKNSKIVDWIFTNYYNKIPVSIQNEEFRAKILDLLRATVGRTAPDFSWKEEGKNYRLSTLRTGKNYLLVFWSTSCSHCVRDIPKLYTFMNGIKNTKVIAFSIENEEFEWNEFKKQLYGWHNIMGTHPKNKWENKTVRTYNLYSTPSYFVLDADKKIIATPYDLKDVITYYKQQETKDKLVEPSKKKELHKK